MRNALAVVIAAAVMACAPKQETAQTDTQPVDTLKAATETLPSPDTVPTVTPTQATTKTVPPVPTNTKTSPDTQTKRDSIIGRDKVTPFDPTKRRLDTVRRRPPA
jgi:hypothetical protein